MKPTQKTLSGEKADETEIKRRCPNCKTHKLIVLTNKNTDTDYDYCTSCGYTGE